MLANIIDNRKSPYKYKKITAIVEPTWHDNNCTDADQSVETVKWFGYDEREVTSVEQAVEWAQLKPGENTLYLYDLGKGTDVVDIHERRKKHAEDKR